MRSVIVVVGLAAVMSMACFAQSSSATGDVGGKKSYRLNFVVQELENERVINSRAYSMVMRNNKEHGSIRAGEKVPFTSSSGTNTQWQQIEIGVSIDCNNLEDLGDEVSVSVKADVSSVVETHRENSPPASLPIIRNNQWESTVVLPMKQATVLFVSDDAESKRRMQLQLTVSPIR